jgi:hypothetical protein
MNYTIELGSGAVIYISGFIKIGCHSKVDRSETYRHTHTDWGSHVPT